MSPYWLRPSYRRWLRHEIRHLGSWYQQIRLAPGIWTRPWTRETIAQWVRCERGDRKLNRFILPMLPVPLEGATVLEMGANAGGNLIWAWRHGALATGVEPDLRYFRQSEFVRDTIWHSTGVLPTWKVYTNDWRLVEPPPSGRYTYAWLLNVIYHMPASERVACLEGLGRCAEYIVLQGNGIGDEPDGRGWNSLMRLIVQAGLRVKAARCEPHVRGLVVVARA